MFGIGVFLLFIVVCHKIGFFLHIPALAVWTTIRKSGITSPCAIGIKKLSQKFVNSLKLTQSKPFTFTEDIEYTLH